MALNCGIVGLPNVGKSTIFSALTSAPAEAANYPFCTIDPNVGIVQVPDSRLQRIAEIIPTEKIIPAAMEFVDIAGLVAGASGGEGLGNRFLAHIRETGMIMQVVRCFDDPDVLHVSGAVDPIRDIETVNVELALADLETVDKRLTRAEREKRGNDRETVARAQAVEKLLMPMREKLEEGEPARALLHEPEDFELIADLHLITAKPQIFVCNVDEQGLFHDNTYVTAVKEYASARGSEVVSLCGQLEADIAAMDDPAERAEFLEEAGLSESGLNRLIHAAYSQLGLRTFFTAGPKEVRAWTFRRGSTAPQAAGVIHSDFQRGFIRAETYHCEDLFTYGSEAKVREAGKLRQEGKGYEVKDGDVMNFKFNV
ncbi:MAG: redox-regulated ATPase YchF [Spirochaetota bacterium]